MVDISTYIQIPLDSRHGLGPKHCRPVDYFNNARNS